MRRYAALSGGGLFALLLLTSTVTMAVPPVSAQVPETVTGLVYKTNSIETEIVTIDKFGGITGDDDSYPFEAFVDQSGWIYYVYDAHDPATVTGMYNDEMRTFQECNDAWCHVVGDDGNLYKVTVPAFDVGVTSPIDRGEYPKIEQTVSTYKLPDGLYQMFQHYPYVKYGGEWIPYILEETDDSVFVRFNDGSLSFDKSECAVTYFNPLEEVLIKSETYNVRSATIGTDDWSHLQVNDAVCNVSYYEEEFQIGTPEVLYVNLTKENGEGVFRVEYHISMGQVKTTAYFENLSLENSKIAFTQSVSFDDPIITLNDTEYDLSQLRGQNFPREILEENEDIFIEARELYFNAGLGFEHLWNVNISDTVPLDKHQVNLDYANQGETQIAIGETQELDPMYHFGNQGWPVKTNVFGHSAGQGTTCFNGANGDGTSQSWYPTGYTGGQYAISYSSWNSSNHPACIWTMIWWDISKIPDWADIENVQWRHYGGCSGCPQYNATQMADGGWSQSTKIVSQMHYGNHWGAGGAGAITYAEGIELVHSGVQGGSYNAQGGLTGGTHEFHQYAQYTPQSGFCYGQTCTAWDTIAGNDRAVADFEQQLRSGNDWFGAIWMSNGNCFRGPEDNSGSSGEGGAQCSVAESFPNRVGGYNSNGVAISGKAEYSGGATMLGVTYRDNQVPAPNAVGSQPLTVSQSQAGSVDLSWYPPPAQNTNGGNHQLGVTLSPDYIISDGENFGTTNGIFTDGTCNSASQTGGWCHEAFIHDNVGGVVTQDSHGVGHNVETGVAGVYGNAWRFNGTTSHVSDIFLNIDPDPTTGWSWFGWVALDSNRPVVNSNVGGSSTIWGNPGIGIDVSLDSHHTGRSFNPDVVRAYANGGYSDSAQNKSFPFDDQTYCYTREGTATNTGNNPNNDSNCNSVWHSIAVTKQAGVASTNIYFDGLLVGTHSGNSSVSGNSVQEYYFGATNQFGTPRYTLDGKLDEFAFYSKELTAWEVGQLHASSHGRVKTHEATHFGGNAMSGQAVYDFPASLIAYYDFEQTGKHTNSGFTDSAVLTNVAIKTDPIRQGATAYSIYNDTDGGGSGLAQGFYGKTQPHVDNLYEYWNFDDGNIAAAIDSGHTPIVRNFISGSDYSNLGGYNAGPTYSVDYTNKKFGTSSLKIYDHTSTTSASAVAVYETKDFNFNFDTPFTVSAWIDARTDISNWWGVLLHKGYNWADADGTWSVGINTNGTVSCGIDDAGSNTSGNSATVTNSAVTDLGWTHLACVWTGMGAYSQGSGSQVDGEWEIYINGVHQPVGTGAGTVTKYTASTVGNPYNYDGTGMLVIGDRGDGAGRYTGWVDDLRIYDTAFSDEDIELLYNFSPDNSEQITIDTDVGTTTTFTDDGWGMYGPTGASTSCGAPSTWNESATNAGYLVVPGTLVTNNNCWVSMSDFDVSTLPSNATITDVDFEYKINSNNNINNYMSCSWVPLHEYSYSQTASFGTPDETINAMLANTPYLIADGGCNTSVGDIQHVDFGDQAVSDLQQMVGQSSNAAMFTVVAKPASDNDHERMTDFPFTADDLNWRMTNNGSGWSTNNPGGESVDKTITDRKLHVTYTVPTDVLTTGGTYAFKIASETPFGNSSQYYWTDGTVGSTQGEVRGLSHEGHDSGAYSNIINYTMLGAADPPTNLVVTDGIPITMTWTAPANNGGSAITDYEIFRDGGSIGTVGSTATSYSDSSVVAGTTYSYEVAAITAMGAGAKSTAANGTAGLAPDPPTVTSVVISDPDNAPDEHTITWTAGATNSAPTTHYTLYQSIGNNTSWNQVVANTGNVLTYDYTTSGLAANTDYYYKLTQTSNHGTSGDSNEDSVTTPDVPAAPVAPTIAINDPNNNPLDITITWVAPSDGGSAITGYMIERHDGSSYSTIVADTGSTAVTYVDTASPSTTYMYRISAINIMGTGSASPDSNSVTTADAPTVPTSVSVASISNSQVDVTWGVPTDDGGSAITAYLIEQQVVGAGSWTTVGTVGPTVFTQAITGLVADTEYNVRVSSSNNVGYGPTAQDSNWTRPDAPAGLSASTTGSNSIDLDWTLSGQTNSTYRIERESPVSGGFSDIVAAHPYNTNNPKYSDTGLVSGTEYNYRIYQSNAGGESLGSNTASNYTQPDAPTNLTVVSTDNDIQLNWTAPSGTVTGYKIERESPVGGGWSVLVGNTASTSTTYDDLNLTYGTQYNYRIAAINAGGGGPSGVAVADWIYPDTPAAFTAATFNDTEIQLQWTKSTNTVTEFRIERESPSGGGFSDVLTPTFASACSGAVCTIQDTGLSTGTQYNYKIYATNLGGENPVASGATNAWTLADPPTVLTATNNGTTIDLAWTAPSGTVTGYQIDRESPVSGGWTVLVADTGNTNVLYADAGLSDGTQYNYRIYSLNTGGMSLTSSNESNAWIVPSIAQNLVAATVSGDTLSLTWDKATHTVTEFKIERDSPTGTGNWAQVLNPTFASVCGGANCTVNDVALASGTQYDYRIIAVNIGGDATASSADNAWTLPDAPVSLAVSTVDATATTANITWAHPSGDTIITYHVERESPVGGGWSALVSLSYPTVAHNDTGLSLLTQYNYRIASENLGGIGPWTTPVSTTTLNVPNAPTTLAHTKSGLEGTRNAVLTWVAPANDGGSPILSYKIERNIGGAGWADAISSTGNTAITATDSGLSSGVEYEYRISAITLVGTGPTSNVESSTFVSGSMTHTSAAIGGNTIEVTPNFTTTDTDEVYLTKVQLYVDGSLSDTETYQPPMQMTANNSYPLTVQYAYPTVEVSVMTKGTFTQDSYTATFSSASADITPLSPFGNNITGLEVRSGQYAQSDFTINAQPAGYDMLMVYQHQDPTVDPEFFYYENVTATLADSVAVESDKDYYVSLYLNIEDNEKVDVTGTSPGVVTLTCVDILDDPLADPAVLPNPGDGIPDQPNCINGKIPLGTESEFVIKSSKDPEAQTQLGIEGMGDLFGMPMVFVFIVGLAAVFTGRSAQMGSVFIIITIGVMSYLGYLSFEFDDFGMSEGITWTLLIFTAIIGILVGKRWS